MKKTLAFAAFALALASAIYAGQHGRMNKTARSG